MITYCCVLRLYSDTSQNLSKLIGVHCGTLAWMLHQCGQKQKFKITDSGQPKSIQMRKSTKIKIINKLPTGNQSWSQTFSLQIGATFVMVMSLYDFCLQACYVLTIICREARIT